MTAKKTPGIEGIEPARLSMPAMDRPSLAFGWFLDRMKIGSDPGSTGGLIMWCDYCTESICDVEDGDNLRVLLNTALAHTCT